MNEKTEKLLDWYDHYGRILPWRQNPSPYHVWISEIMLQQTRVEAVKGYYQRFLDALPNLQSLAEASEELYMKLWEGLGYYSRVRNMHRAAVMIMDQYGGVFPKTAEELQKLPGIGPYTAAAIASIAFGEKAVAVDGNLIRVFTRITEYEGDAKTPAGRKAAEEYYTELQPEERPGDFNQALMDLGAGICVPNGFPLCAQCPWETDCLAHGSGRETDFPVIPAKKQRKVEERTVFVIHFGEKIVLHRRPSKGLLAGLYEFPNTLGNLNPSKTVDYLENTGFKLCREADAVRPLGKTRHIFTHLEWHMNGYSVQADPAAGLPETFIAVSQEELETFYTIPSAFQFYRNTLQTGKHT